MQFCRQLKKPALIMITMVITAITTAGMCYGYAVEWVRPMVANC